MRTSKQPPVTGTCKHCGGAWSMAASLYRAYSREYGEKQYCSRPCYNEARHESPISRTCVECSEPFTRSARDLKRYEKRIKGVMKFCSNECMATFYSRERATGVGYFDKSGYFLTKHEGKLVYRHRLVMEQTIGRALHKGETVHHLNGDRGDCRPENLQLWSKQQPSGQRVSDKIEFYSEFLRQYGVEVFMPLSNDYISGQLSLV